jgi:hypothetical protein
MLKRNIALTVLLLLLLASCTPRPGYADDPADVHARWIAAVRGGDERAAQALWADDTQQGRQMVAMIVSTMAGYLAPNPRTGELVDIDVHMPEHSGTRTVGRSVWHFTKITWCYDTVLGETPSGWRVRDWGQAGQCPEAS